MNHNENKAIERAEPDLSKDPNAVVPNEVSHQACLIVLRAKNQARRDMRTLEVMHGLTPGTLTGLYLDKVLNPAETYLEKAKE